MAGKLVLVRRPGQSFEIDCGGERIVVYIAQVRGAQVRVAIEANPEVKIARSELLERAKVGLGGK